MTTLCGGCGDCSAASRAAGSAFGSLPRQACCPVHDATGSWYGHSCAVKLSRPCGCVCMCMVSVCVCMCAWVVMLNHVVTPRKVWMVSQTFHSRCNCCLLMPVIDGLAECEILDSCREIGSFRHLRGIYLVRALPANLFAVITLMRYLPAFQSCFRKQEVVVFWV